MIRGMKKIFLIAVTNSLFAATAFAAQEFETVFGKSCDSYTCWINEVWNWAMMIIVPLSVLILSAAGVIYMTSEGDSNRVSIAKKMIMGVFSGVGLLILTKLILTVIGVEDQSWNINETTFNNLMAIWNV